MGKRTRSQRQGSSPKNKVSSHRFPANNKLPRKFDEVGEIVDLIHSPAHTAPLAKIKFEDGTIVILLLQKEFQLDKMWLLVKM